MYDFAGSGLPTNVGFGTPATRPGIGDKPSPGYVQNFHPTVSMIPQFRQQQANQPDYSDLLQMLSQYGGDNRQAPQPQEPSELLRQLGRRLQQVRF